MFKSEARGLKILFLQKNLVLKQGLRQDSEAVTDWSILKGTTLRFCKHYQREFPHHSNTKLKVTRKVCLIDNICVQQKELVCRERKRPLYCSEDIIRLNIQNAAEVQKINFGRKNIQNSLGKGIDDCKTKIAVLEKN